MFQPLQEALSTLFSYIPQLIGALIILIIGYIVAKVLQAIVGRVLQSIGFDGWMERGGIKQFFDRAQTTETPHSILGKLVFWFVFIIALTMAADALGIPQVSAVLGQLISYIPSIIAAILILILAALLANFLSGIVRGARDSRRAYCSYVPDSLGGGGPCSGDSVRYRWYGCSLGHHSKGLQLAPGGETKLHQTRKQL